MLKVISNALKIINFHTCKNVDIILGTHFRKCWKIYLRISIRSCIKNNFGLAGKSYKFVSTIE